MLMTDLEIVNRLKAIRNASFDAEKAHLLENQLYLDFIQYIAGIDSYFGRKAKSVLLSQNIKFNRHYA